MAVAVAGLEREQSHRVRILCHMSVSRYHILCHTCQCQDITFYATHVSVKISHLMPHMSVSRYHILCHTCQCQDITFYATHVSVKISHFMPHMPVSRYAPEYGKMGMFRYMSVYGLCHHTPVHATPKSFSFHKLWLK